MMDHAWFIRASLATLVAATGCVGRTGPSQDVGTRVAKRLCPTQDACGCEEHEMIQDCFATVRDAVNESETEAVDLGLTYDDECMDAFVRGIDTLAACEPSDGRSWIPGCSVYFGEGEVGDACRFVEVYPPMQTCRRSLSCEDRICVDLTNRPVVGEGAVCDDRVTTPDLVVCAEGLVCDLFDSGRCIPRAPLSVEGDACEHPTACEQGLYCRPAEGAVEPSPSAPGVCSPNTADGAACDSLFECEYMCLDGRCASAPAMACGVAGGWAARREFLDR